MEESHQNLPISPAPSSASLSSQPVFTFGSLPSPSPPINTSAPQTALSIPETTQKTPSSRPTPKPAINLTLSNPFSLISPPLDPPSSPTIDMPLSFSDQTSLATTIIALPAVFAPRAGSYISKEQASLSNAPTITLPLAHIDTASPSWIASSSLLNPNPNPNQTQTHHSLPLVSLEENSFPNGDSLDPSL